MVGPAPKVAGETSGLPRGRSRPRGPRFAWSRRQTATDTTSPRPRGGRPIRPNPGSGPPWPTKVTGYTKHALERMEQRGVTPGQVDDIVANPQFQPKWQPKERTWLYERDGIRVTLNRDGHLVTVMIPQ